MSEQDTGERIERLEERVAALEALVAELREAVKLAALGIGPGLGAFGRQP